MKKPLLALLIGGAAVIVMGPAFGHEDEEYLVSRGVKTKTTGDSYRCVTGESTTSVIEYWERSDLYRVAGKPAAPNPSNHPHSQRWSTTYDVTRGHSKYRSECDWYELICVRGPDKLEVAICDRYSQAPRDVACRRSRSASADYVEEGPIFIAYYKYVPGDLVCTEGRVD